MSSDTDCDCCDVFDVECPCMCHSTNYSPYHFWRTNDGRMIPLIDMETAHLENLFGFLEKKLLSENGRHVIRERQLGRWSLAVSAELDRRRRPTV